MWHSREIPIKISESEKGKWVYDTNQAAQSYGGQVDLEKYGHPVAKPGPVLSSRNGGAKKPEKTPAAFGSCVSKQGQKQVGHDEFLPMVVTQPKIMVKPQIQQRARYQAFEEQPKQPHRNKSSSGIPRPQPQT